MLSGSMGCSAGGFPFTGHRGLIVGSEPSHGRRDRVSRLQDQLLRHAHWFVCIAQRVTQRAVASGAAGDTTAEPQIIEPFVLYQQTVTTLRADIVQLQQDNEDLRASARLWADLYHAALKRANELEQRLGGEAQRNRDSETTN